MAKEKEVVTNAMRILKKAGIDFETVRYESSGEAGENFGEKIAALTGIDPNMSFKTLTLRGKTEIYVACIPVNKELDLKKLAEKAGEKKVEMLAVKELLGIVGYERGSVSPVGTKKKFKTFIDKSVLDLDKMAISGGMMGITLLLDSKKLISLLDAETEDITKN